MHKKVRKTIIPAAGFGTRFLPATKAQAKFYWNGAMIVMPSSEQTLKKRAIPSAGPSVAVVAKKTTLRVSGRWLYQF